MRSRRASHKCWREANHILSVKADQDLRHPGPAGTARALAAPRGSLLAEGSQAPTPSGNEGGEITTQASAPTSTRMESQRRGPGTSDTGHVWSKVNPHSRQSGRMFAGKTWLCGRGDQQAQLPSRKHAGKPIHTFSWSRVHCSWSRR